MKHILDVTCGGRMMWFNKHHPNTLYLDKRTVPTGTIDQQPNWEVAPDIEADFTNLPFADSSFKMVVFDPPHIEGPYGHSIMGTKYGVLSGDWRTELAQGFAEIWRVLDDYGVLIFKWGEASATVRDVLNLLPPYMEPLFGHTTGKSGKTKWITFMKVPPE